MALPAPNLDDRKFQDIVDQAKRLIPLYCREWTDHNVSDPGVALIELFAWMTDMLLSTVRFPASFDLVWSVALGVVALGFVTVVVLVVVNVVRARRKGISPLTSQVDLAARLLQSRALQPDRSLDERLVELDDLAARGVISTDEHREARAAVLRGDRS